MAGAILNLPSGGDYTLEDVVTRNFGSDIVYTGTADVKDYVFYSSAITSFRAENASKIGGNCFQSCTSLKSIYLGGNNASIGAYAVRYCSALEELRIPKWGAYGGIGGYGLQGCTSLKLIDYGLVGTLGFNNLPACPLDTIILHKTTGIQALSNNALNNSTAFKSGGTGGHVYIPEVMYNHLGDGSNMDYKAATNWSTYQGYGTITWHKLEGSIYE